jgi:hypothetical protein
MAGFFNVFDSVDEENNDKDAQANIDAQNKIAKTVTPQQALAASQIYKKSPWIPARVILDMAKNPSLSPQAQEAISGVAGKKYIETNTPNKPDDRNWFEKTIYDPAKAATRWGFAALQFTPDVVQNVASQVFSANDPSGVDGWFASTQLGAMASGQDTGSGFFIGGEAAKTQAQKARDFRGTINGHAWTVGRGAADVFFTPGSKEYSLLSGFFDAAVNIFADPTLYAGQAFKLAKTGEYLDDTVKGLVGTRKVSQKLATQLVDRGLVQTDKIPALTGEAALAASKIAKGEIGLDSAEAISFRNSDYFSWFERNNKAVRMAARIAGFGEEATTQIAARKLTGTAAAALRGKAAFQIMEDFKGTIDPATAARLADADSPLKVKAIIGEAAARLSANVEDVMLPRQIGDVAGTGATAAAREVIRERIPLYRTIRNSRWYTDIPTENVLNFGTGLERSKAVTNMANFLRGLKIHTALPETFDNFVGEAMSSLSVENAAERKVAAENIYAKFIEIITEQSGGDVNIAREATRRIKEELAKIRVFGADEMGNLDDGGLLQHLRQLGLSDKELSRFGPDELDQLRIQGPTALVELAENVYVMPDYRKLRSLTGNKITKFALTNAKTGDQRLIPAIAEQLQTEIWKPMVLATGGYVVRNMIDSQIRIGARGYENFFTHPFHFIQTVMGSRYVGPLTGNLEGKAITFEDSLDDVGGALTKVLNDFQDSTSKTLYQTQAIDPLAANERMLRTENFSLIDRGLDAEGHTTGYVDNLGQIYNDPILRRVAAIWNLPKTERTAAIVDWLETSTEGKEAAKSIVAYFKNGVRIADPKTGRTQFIKIENIDDTNLIASWVDKAASAKIQTIIRNDEELRFVVAHNRVPRIQTILDERGIPTTRPTATPGGGLTSDVQFEPRMDPIRLDTVVYAGDSTTTGVGGLVKLDAGGEGIIIRVDNYVVPDPFNPGTTITQPHAIIQPVAPEEAFTVRGNDPGLFGSKGLREMVDLKGNQGKLAQKVKVANRIVQGKTQKLDRLSKSLDSGVDWFFTKLVGKATQKLERSPLYRQAFYREVADKAVLLSPSEQTRLQQNIIKYVDDLNADLIDEGKKGSMTVEKYVGNQNIYNKIFGKASTGDGTIEELEQFASSMAVYDLKKTLYNAQEKNNLEDMLRVVMPFATAFRETLGQYSSYLIEDPSRIRKTQLAFNAANYDSDNLDNALSGWFGKDSTDGKNVFNFPAGGWAGSLLAFPMKGAFQVLNLPGGGPVVQIAASELLPDTPKLDFVRNMVLPYGDVGLKSLAPQWAVRGIEAIRGDTTNMATIFGTTYAETVRFLVQTGEYDMKNPNEVAKMYSDAKRKARIMSGLRALFQFTGPTSPRIDFRLETDGGDITASALSQEFFKLQENNRDTAVEEFIKKFGEDAFIYLGHKTEPVKGGLEPTKQFDGWQRNNSDLFNEYGNTAGYLAPGGDGFSFQTWNRQLNNKNRRRLTAPEMVAAAQYKIGASIYREKRNQLGDTLSSEQRDWLAQWRVFLNKEYPGFPAKAQFNPGELDAFTKELRNLVSDNRVSNNATAQSVAQYLDARDEALQKAAEAGLSSLDSVRAQPLKDWLSSIAATLVQQNPEFARIFEDKLAGEVD